MDTRSFSFPFSTSCSLHNSCTYILLDHQYILALFLTSMPIFFSPSIVIWQFPIPPLFLTVVFYLSLSSQSHRVSSKREKQCIHCPLERNFNKITLLCMQKASISTHRFVSWRDLHRPPYWPCLTFQICPVLALASSNLIIERQHLFIYLFILSP